MLHLQRREVLIGLASVTLAQAVFGRTGAVLAADKIKPTASSALIVVDVQNCFLPGGSLAVKEGDQDHPGDQPIAKGVRKRRDDARLAHAAPHLVCIHPSRARSRSR